MLQKFNTWTIKDRHKGLPLEDIPRISDRAFSFVSRNKANLNSKEGAMNLLGVLDILEALDYHFDNFINLKTTNEEINQRHEAVAYLNRIGQLYYFIVSDFTVRHIPNAISYMSKVNDLKVFRMKSTAHRSLDFPKGESEEYQNRQALTMLGATNSKVLGKLEYILPVQNKLTKKTEWHFFTPETDHEIVMAQSYKLIKLMVEKIIN